MAGELHAGHTLLRDRVQNAYRRRVLLIDMCENGVKDTFTRRGYDAVFTEDEVKLIEDFINSI